MNGYAEVKRVAKKMGEFSKGDLITAVIKRRPDLSRNADRLINKWVAEQVKRRAVVKTNPSYYAIR
ncbi:MAG: hypothetical protein AAB772_01765 [Patescibacteria group bacterium]